MRLAATAARKPAVRTANEPKVNLTGAALKRAISVLKDKLPDHLQSDGIVSLKGKPTFHAIGIRGSYEVTGQIKVNALEGDIGIRSFKAKLALAQGTLTGFRAW